MTGIVALAVVPIVILMVFVFSLTVVKVDQTSGQKIIKDADSLKGKEKIGYQELHNALREDRLKREFIRSDEQAGK